MKAWVILLYLATSLTSCNMNKPIASQHDKATKRLEPFLSVRANLSQIEFRVISTGCTRPENFSLAVDNKGRHCRVSVYRTQPDRCRRAPFAVDLTIDIKQYTKACQDLRVANPLRRGIPD